ncbi:MMPL family transporter [Luteolibacter marinus]|uniref:MMPL family transporter n=1 Tax=Luteolibacter marinus TaxID=2776705 RepID=UPI0018672705|nr:MMPL family transporter [Luteolibacter marinus]
MRKWWWQALLLGLVAVAAMGLGRIRFDTDVLSVLPGDMPEVRGLQIFQQAFSRDEEMVMLLECDEDHAGELPQLAEELAGKLKEDGLAATVRWQPRWRDDPAGLADLVAYLWLNGDSAELEALTASLDPDQVDGTLEEAMERVATALDGGDIALSSHDPFGFLNHSSMRALFAASEEGGEAFESADGRFHLLFADAPGPLPGYREMEAWKQQLAAVTEAWGGENGVKVRFTGEPAFAGEIGSAMENDMRGTVGITATVIALLFLAMQRRLGLLAGLSGVLGLVFLTAMGLAGWIYGELSIMAAGFAAILIGLTVDYGVLICQEAKVAGHEAAALRRATGKSILWAALTTAIVFVALNRSGLPGIAQLGTVVACGIIAGAVLMLVFYVPWVARCGAGRADATWRPAWLPGNFGSRVTLLLLIGAAAATLGRGGLPGVEFDSRLLRPRDSPAMEAFERIQFAYPAWNSPALKLVVEADSDEQMRERLEEAAVRIGEAQAANPDIITRHELPATWWPDPEVQASNRPLFTALAARKDALVAAADEAGFSEEGTALGRTVLDAMSVMATSSTLVFPDQPAAQEIMRGYVNRHEGGGGVVLGTVETSPIDNMGEPGLQTLRSLNGDGIWLAGWAMLKPAVLPLVKKDVTDVLIPMAVLMVIMLAIVFRKFAEVGLSLIMLFAAAISLLALMRCFGVQWNFLNIAALPLLLGTGIDYSIHILLALRRSGGNTSEVWNGTGKAVLFCGTSTAIGFGSLCFASNDALASMGQVAVTGILLCMILSVFLLPGLAARKP